MHRRVRADRVVDEAVHEWDWLARRGALRFAHRGEPFDDLLQVARVGLLKAIARFDPSREVPFPGYATSMIVGELRRHFRDHGWDVHVGRSAKDLAGVVAYASGRLSGELGRSPTPGEIAAHLGVSDEAVVEAVEAQRVRHCGPLEPHHEPHHDAHVVDHHAAALDHHVVHELLATLPAREREVVYLRNFEQLSQADIAARVGCSQVHVGRILAASLRSLSTW